MKHLIKKVSNKKVITVLFAAFVLFSFISENLYAQRGRGRHKEFRRHGPGPKGCFFRDSHFLKEILKLSDQQIKKIGDINKKYKIKLLDIKEKLSPMKFKLRKLLLKDNINLNSVKRVLEKMGKLKIEIRFLRIKQRVEIESILTPEQKRKLRFEKRSKRKGRRNRHWN